MSVPNIPIPSEPAERSLNGDMVGALIVVGAVAAVFVTYLAVDWIKTRRESRKLALRREQAREAWQRELHELQQRPPPEDPSPSP